MEEKLCDEARGDLFLDELSGGGMCEELKEYMLHFNVFLFFVLGEDGLYKPKVRY